MAAWRSVQDTGAVENEPGSFRDHQLVKVSSHRLALNSASEYLMLQAYQ
jgi:hypothetical protein